MHYDNMIKAFIYFCELHSQITTFIRMFYPWLVGQCFIIWWVTFGYFMTLVVDFGMWGDVSWWSFENWVVLILYMPFIHFLLGKTKKKSNKSEKQMEKLSKERLKKVEKKILKIPKRVVNNSVWHGCIIIYTHFQWSI